MIDLPGILKITRFEYPGAGSGNDATRVTTCVQVLTNKLKWTATDIGLAQIRFVGSINALKFMNSLLKSMTILTKVSSR